MKKLLLFILTGHMMLADCEPGYVQECTGGGVSCCPESWIGDGNCDDGDDCNLECYYYDGGDCGTPGCGPGKVPDCSDSDCCDALWLDDGFCDGEDQPRGCDLSCHLYDGWDCMGDTVAGNHLTIDCYSCYGYSTIANISCDDLLHIEVFMPSNMNCYMCDEIFNCYGECAGDGYGDPMDNMPAYQCCDNQMACYESECENVFDECGVCGGNSIGPNTGVQDCAGTCWGNATIDCNGVCGGGAVVDECGTCDGPGMPEGACDCLGSTLDSCGVCGGDDLADVGCGCFEPFPDICGVCGGDGIDCNNDGIDDDCEDELLLGAASGDVNGDGVLNVSDIVMSIEMIINGE